MTINNGNQKYTFDPSIEYKNKRFVQSYFTKSNFNVYPKLGDIIIVHNSTLLVDVDRTYLFILVAVCLTAFIATSSQL